ncbi:hypothetical protein DW028_11755 [Agathobacter rectalis]|uniref:Uncharacterized protein n=1 Tax=Agathobacter rectalis TaxID=39491 RepID=A0A415JTL2_9FIRM|nr:hypothetical protein DW028_11755 [Agathobacter rectalis]
MFSMLDETGFYAPSLAHNALPCLPWQGISVFHGIILTISKSLRNRLQIHTYADLIPYSMLILLKFKHCTTTHTNCPRITVTRFYI